MTVSEKVEVVAMGTVLAMPAKKRAAPITESRKVEGRKHLTPDEVDRLIDGAKRSSRYPARDALLLLMAYRHGFRATELVSLRWSQVDLKGASLHVQRIKRGKPSTHPLGTKELRALAALRKEQPNAEYIFLSERGTPMSADNLRKLVTRSSEAAGLDIKAHPHMLRHACGYALANDGRDTRLIQDYLGHVNIQHTVVYTESAAHRFKGLWKD